MLLRSLVNYRVLIISSCTSSANIYVSRIKSEAKYQYLQGKYYERKWQANFTVSRGEILTLSGLDGGDLPKKGKRGFRAGVILKMESKPSQEYAH